MCDDPVVRILGVAVDDLTGWRDRGSHNRWGGLFRGLEEHADVVDVVRVPRPPGQIASRLVDRATGGRVTVNPGWRAGRFHSRTALLEPYLHARDGKYDVILQVHTLHRPGLRRRPYVIYTDSTNALLERHDPTADLAPPRARKWQALECRVATQALKVYTCSEFARRSLVEDYGCAPHQVLVAGAGANSIRAAVPDRSTHTPRVLFIGYNFRRKGGLTLLDAWSEVERQLPDAELVIAGPRDPFKAQGRNIRWVGRVNEAQVSALYREATVFVLPSLYEPFGLVALEAMGNGLPVVASRCCALPEIVADGESGMLTTPADPDALARALIELLSQPGRAAAMGRAGHALVMSQHTWGHVGARITDSLPTDL
jgi:alpha-maltose-1-phosphate synthase